MAKTPRNVMTEQKNYEESFYSNERLNEVLHNSPAVTTLVDAVFLPGRIPKDLVQQISADPALLEQQLLAEKPLLSTIQRKAYWSKGQQQRDFDTAQIQVYSAICVADDRHLLEALISTGGCYTDVSGLTLRQGLELSGVNFSLSHLPYQYQTVLDVKIFSGNYEYFLVDFAPLFELLNLKNQKANKKTVLSRLNRLSQMLLVLDFEKDGKILPNYHTRIKLVESSYIPLVAPDQIKNKKSITSDTMTHLLVGVHRAFTASLKTEGAITRSRFLKVYPNLSGRDSAVDFFKFLDSHKREYVHGKLLSQLITDYYNNKVRISKQHISRHLNKTKDAILLRRHVLQSDFNLILVEQVNDKGKPDYIFIYQPTEG